MLTLLYLAKYIATVLFWLSYVDNFYKRSAEGKLFSVSYVNLDDSKFKTDFVELIKIAQQSKNSTEGLRFLNLHIKSVISEFKSLIYYSVILNVMCIFVVFDIIQFIWIAILNILMLANYGARIFLLIFVWLSFLYEKREIWSHP